MAVFRLSIERGSAGRTGGRKVSDKPVHVILGDRELGVPSTHVQWV